MADYVAQITLSENLDASDRDTVNDIMGALGFRRSIQSGFIRDVLPEGTYCATSAIPAEEMAQRIINNLKRDFSPDSFALIFVQSAETFLYGLPRAQDPIALEFSSTKRNTSQQSYWPREETSEME